jgi:hypothetical protein
MERGLKITCKNSRSGRISLGKRPPDSLSGPCLPSAVRTASVGPAEEISIETLGRPQNIQQGADRGDFTEIAQIA